MVIKESTYLNIIGRGYRSFPILALERFLRTKRWKNGVFPVEIKQTIKSAIAFLNLALAGYRVIDTASREKTFSGNLPAIRAYNAAAKAYELLADKSIPFYNRIVNSKEALLLLVNKSSEEISEMDEKEIDQMYNYVVELAKVLYSDQ